jgi:uncharacterized protein DUF4190
MWNAAPGTDHGGIPRGNPMSTPQNPGDDAPQDPQNPYGGTPPPPSSDPLPPPSDPSAPPPPAYGQPQYGQPQYGQPQPGMPGQPAFPQYGAPAKEEAGKGMAIAALVVSFFGCTCVGALVAIPLAIVVLVRGKDGRNHGKGLAIAALIISVLSLLAGIAIAIFASYVSQFDEVNDLKTGQCITAKGLTDEKSTGVTEIKSVGCSSKHDGEVLGTSKVTAGDADSYTDPLGICTPPVTEAGNADVLTNEALTIIALTEDSSPKAGDKLVCVIANSDGSDLTSKLGS